MKISEKFKLFSDFSGLKPNTTKCEIARICVLKGVQATVCGMRCIDLRNEAIKILGICFSYNLKTKDQKKFYNISNVQGVLDLRRIRNLTLERRMVVFKTLAKSKIIFLALLTKITYQVVKELGKTQKSILWKNSTPKIKHETTCKDYKDGGLKMLLVYGSLR